MWPEPLHRPASFFDVEQQGEGLTDVGTHLVDLVPWMLFPGQGIDAFSDLNLNGSEPLADAAPVGGLSGADGLLVFPIF